MKVMGFIKYGYSWMVTRGGTDKGIVMLSYDTGPSRWHHPGSWDAVAVIHLWDGPDL